MLLDSMPWQPQKARRLISTARFFSVRPWDQFSIFPLLMTSRTMRLPLYAQDMASACSFLQLMVQSSCMKPILPVNLS
jgi:hypothetical protein